MWDDLLTFVASRVSHNRCALKLEDYKYLISEGTTFTIEHLVIDPIYPSLAAQLTIIIAQESATVANMGKYCPIQKIEHVFYDFNKEGKIYQMQSLVQDEKSLAI